MLMESTQSTNAVTEDGNRVKVTTHGQYTDLFCGRERPSGPVVYVASALQADYSAG